MTRYQRIALIGVKTSIRAKLNRERLRFRKDRDLIAKLEAAIESDELLLLSITEQADDFEKHVESQVSDGASALEFGDGTLLEMWLEFFTSPEFEKFIDQVLRIIEKIFELIGGIA